MAEIYIFDDGYIAVGKPQLLHHAYVFYPPSPGTKRAQYASDINRIIRIERRIKDDSGNIKTTSIPMEYRNYELTASDISSTNKVLRDPDSEQRNQHRYLTEKELANNPSSYSTERERMTWDKVHDEDWIKSHTYRRRQGSLRKALFDSPRNRFSSMSFPELVAERKRAIKEKSSLRAKGIAAWRRRIGNIATIGVEGIELSRADRYRYNELDGTVRLLDEKLGLNLTTPVRIG